jgi:hypothetical protein
MLWLGYVLREVVKFSAFDSLQNYQLNQLKTKFLIKNNQNYCSGAAGQTAIFARSKMNERRIFGPCKLRTQYTF